MIDTKAPRVPGRDAAPTGPSETAQRPFADTPLAKQFPSVPHLREAARARLPRFAYDYLSGGLGRESCLHGNEEAFDSVHLTPRYMFNIDEVDPSIELFGRRWTVPMGVSPVGFGGLFHPGGEVALAAAAKRHGLPFAQSTFSTETIEDIGRSAGLSYLFQLYNCRDRGVVADLIARAKHADAAALILTIDTPLYSKRERDWRNGLSLSMRPSARQLLDIARHPRWASRILARGVPRLKTLEHYIPAASRGTGVGLDAMFALTDTWCDWDAFDFVRKQWTRPLVVKGIIDIQNAHEAVEHGADALIISNHGGRQFDGAPPTISVLPGIAEAMKDRVPLLLDSGVRSGLDVLRAASRGARFSFSGRTFYYAVAALGDAGADHIMALLIDEVTRELKQLGRASCDELRAATRPRTATL